MGITVSGPALALRYATPDDAQALFALGSDPAVSRFFSWGPYTAAQQAMDYIESLPAKRENGELLDFLIVRGHDGEALGVTGLSELSARDRRCVIGTWLAPALWGTGVNAEVKALVTALAFRALGMERLSAYADVDNGRSQTALERLGFEREGVLHAWHRHGDRVRDVTMYALLKSRWERSALAEVAVEIKGEPPEAWTIA